MLPRFLVPDLDAGESAAVLPAEEAHHLTRVLRLRVGDEVAVFDGRGHEFRAEISSITRDAVTVTLLERAAPPSPPPVALTVVQSVLKGEAMDDVVRDCTMIGVAGIQPVVSERTAVRIALESKAHDRWRRVAVASAKQCGRSMLPNIGEPMPLSVWLRAEIGGMPLVLVEPAVAATDVMTMREVVNRPVPRAAALLVGPEGGWTPAERDLALGAGWIPLSLGGLTLRADRVAFAAAAALLAIWDRA